jgi:hypothetical protein
MINQIREESLAAAQLNAVWDSLHSLFNGGESLALGGYADMLWP